MAVESWGLLPKSQIDDETIEEAIARLIQAHDDDANAHLDAGQSLNSHKASEIIDHLALSIVEDKIGDGEVSLRKLLSDHRFIISAFESLDGWGTVGSIYLSLGNAAIWTTAIANNIAEIYCTPANWTPIDWDKDMFWQSTVKLSHNTSQVVYFGMGGSDNLGYSVGFGFKINNGTLYCYHAVDAGAGYVYTTQEITGITITDFNVYRIIYTDSTGELSFYVNGVLKKTWSSGLPTDDSDGLALFEIKTTTTEARKLYVSDFLFSTPK